MYICIYIYVYVYMCIYIHIHKIYVCVCIYINVYVRVRIHVGMLYVRLRVSQCVAVCDAVYCTVLHYGRLESVGSKKLYVSFAKEPCKRDYILQKRPIILSMSQ